MKLYRGDCLEVMKSMPDKSVDAVITDPPYFQPASHYCPTRDGRTNKKTIGDLSILESFFRLFIEESIRLLKPTGFYYLFCDGQSYPIAFAGLYKHVKNVRPLIWDKVVSYNGYTWRHQHELIAFAELEESPRIPTGDGDILSYRAVKVDNRLHPAEKPVDLLGAIINKTVKCGIVLDPFMGSGSVGVACINNDRDFIGIDIDEDYFSIAEKRIAESKQQLRLAV